MAAAARRGRPGADDRASDEEVVGYALIGRCRGGPGGEIQELYIRPDCQGLGFGSRLFAGARAELRARGIAPLTVWCLAANRIGDRVLPCPAADA